MGSIYYLDVLNKGVIHIPDGLEQAGTRFHHAIQNGSCFQPYKLFIPKIFHLQFLDCGCLWITKYGKKNHGCGRKMQYYLTFMASAFLRCLCVHFCNCNSLLTEDKSQGNG